MSPPDHSANGSARSGTSRFLVAVSVTLLLLCVVAMVQRQDVLAGTFAVLGVGVAALTVFASQIRGVIDKRHPKARSTKTNRKATIARRVTYGLAVAILGFPIVLFAFQVSRALGETDGRSLHNHVADAGKTDYVTQPCKGRSGTVTRSQPNQLILTIHSVDVVHDTMQIDVALCLSDDTLTNLRYKMGHTHSITPFAGNIPNSSVGRPRGLLHAKFKTLLPMKSKSLPRANVEARVRAKFKSFVGSRFKIVFHGTKPAFTWERSVSIKTVLDQHTADSPDRKAVPVHTIYGQLLGSPQHYPRDLYTATGQWSVRLPRDLDFPTSLQKRIQASPSVPDLQWHSGESQQDDFQLSATRTMQSQAFIGFVALLPLFLLLSVWVTLKPRGLRRGTAPPPTDGVIGLAAVILAVLPIRAVLVPSDFQGLTLLDYLLGTEMAFMVAVALILVARARWPPTTTETERQADS